MAPEMQAQPASKRTGDASAALVLELAATPASVEGKGSPAAFEPCLDLMRFEEEGGIRGVPCGELRYVIEP